MYWVRRYIRVVVAVGLQLLAGFFRQAIAGFAWRSVPIWIK